MHISDEIIKDMKMVHIIYTCTVIKFIVLLFFLSSQFSRYNFTNDRVSAVSLLSFDGAAYNQYSLSF